METRISEEGDFVRRRRLCQACDKRFTTYERADVSFPAIVKKDGRRIEFERPKLRASMNKNCSAWAFGNWAHTAWANLSCASSENSTKSPMCGLPVFTAILKTSMSSRSWSTSFANSVHAYTAPRP